MSQDDDSDVKPCFIGTVAVENGCILMTDPGHIAEKAFALKRPKAGSLQLTLRSNAEQELAVVSGTEVGNGLFSVYEMRTTSGRLAALYIDIDGAFDDDEEEEENDEIDEEDEEDKP